MHNIMSEREIEYKITEKLKELNWKLDFNKEKNVYFQKGKEQENKKLGRLKPDFILYSSKSKKPIAIIEAKKPNENLEKALKQAENYARIIGVNLIFAYDGYTLRVRNIKFNEELFYGGTPISEFLSENILTKFINKWKINFDFGKKIKNEKDFITKMKNIENLLRKEGLKDGDERFTEFAKILFLKMISQKEDKEYIWEEIKDCLYNNKNTIEKIDYFLVKIDKEFRMGKYGTKINIQSLEIVNDIVERLSEIDFVNTSLDVKGSAFEYFLNYKGKNDDLAQYFTPREITRFLVELANPKIKEKIYDPFCGSGGILIKSFDYIKNQIINSAKDIKFLKEKQLFGTDISTIAYVAKMNMILVGDGHTNIIQQKDGSLWNKRTDQYDLVITNIPFSLPVGEEKALYDIHSNDGNSICVQHCLDSLIKQDSSRAIIIVPEKFIFSSSSKKTRKKILENYDVKVFSLPQGVFLPYAIAKSSIIELKWKRKKDIKDISFEYIEIKNVGFTPNNSKMKIQKNDMTGYINDINSMNVYKITYEDLLKNDFQFKPNFRIDSGIKISQILEFSEKNKEKEEIDEQKKYFEITVKINGLGAYRRIYNKEFNIKEKYGRELKIRRMIIDEDFIYSTLDARNGGFAKINKNIVGGLYSTTYKCFNLKAEYKELNLNFLSKILSNQKFKEHFLSLSNGTTNRRTISKENFLNTRLGISKEELLINSEKFGKIEKKKKTLLNKLEKEEISEYEIIK